VWIDVWNFKNEDLKKMFKKKQKTSQPIFYNLQIVTITIIGNQKYIFKLELLHLQPKKCC